MDGRHCTHSEWQYPCLYEQQNDESEGNRRERLSNHQSRRPPKANIGTPEKVSVGVWRLWIDSPEERIVTYHL